LEHKQLVEENRINDNIIVTVLHVRGGTVRLGI